MAKIEPVKDQQTVTRNWESVRPLIAGVTVKPVPTLQDERGELVEVYRQDWGVMDAPLFAIHQVGIRPKKIKGWSLHLDNDDRLFVSLGFLRIALFDNRTDSPTYRLLNILALSERNRALVVVPRGVYHAIENIGEGEAVMISMPTSPFDYEDPDKYRLPIKNDLIPFAFEEIQGW